MRDLIEKIRNGEYLSREESCASMSWILTYAADKEIHDFLIAMNTRENSLDELVGFALGMRAHTKPARRPNVNPLLDPCGTGGDGYKTINTSTAVAIVAAASGVPVAKHGNRSISSQSGSADVLEELGYNIDMPPEKCAEMIEKIGFAFYLAPNFHPAMKRVASIRKAIGRTIFNKLGPLCNPVSPSAQLVGVYDESLCEPFCHALNELGVNRALVVCSKGLDEISNLGETAICELNKGEIIRYTVAPEDFGLSRTELKDIQGGNPKENARYMLDIFEGARGPMRDFVALNSGAAIYIGGVCMSLKDAVVYAGEIIDSGAASRKSKEVIEYSNR